DDDRNGCCRDLALSEVNRCMFKPSPGKIRSDQLAITAEVAVVAWHSGFDYRLLRAEIIFKLFTRNIFEAGKIQTMNERQLAYFEYYNCLTRRTGFGPNPCVCCVKMAGRQNCNQIFLKLIVIERLTNAGR